MIIGYFVFSSWDGGSWRVALINSTIKSYTLGIQNGLNSVCNKLVLSNTYMYILNSPLNPIHTYYGCLCGSD